MHKTTHGKNTLSLPVKRQAPVAPSESWTSYCEIIFSQQPRLCLLCFAHFQVAQPAFLLRATECFSHVPISRLYTFTLDFLDTVAFLCIFPSIHPEARLLRVTLLRNGFAALRIRRRFAGGVAMDTIFIPSHFVQ